MKKNKDVPQMFQDERRASILTTVTPRASVYSQRGDHGMEEDAIQMTPVPSPSAELAQIGHYLLVIRINSFIRTSEIETVYKRLHHQ